MIRLILCLLMVLMGTGWGLAQTTKPTTSPATQPLRAGKVAIIPMEEGIDDYTFHKLKKRIELAKVDGVDTLVIKLNTPGGAVGPTLEITRLLKKEAENFHIVVYIDEMAYSAGTMISVACKEIVMSEGSMIGDCAPILPTQGGLAEITGANRAKIESPLVAEFEDSAERNGYDPLLLRSFVQYQLTVYVLEKDGDRRFAAREVKDQLLTEGWKLDTDIKNPIDDELTLLTVNDRTAAQLGLSKGSYKSVEAFVESRGWTIVKVYEHTPDETFIAFMSGNAVRSIFSLMLVVCLLVVSKSPGTGFAEAGLLIAGSVLFGVPMMTGYGGWLEILLMLLGVALLAAEIFIIPGFGVAGVSGIVLIMTGLVLTFVPSEAPALPAGPYIVPQLPQTREGLKEGLIIVTSGMVAGLFLWLWLSRYITKVPYFNRLVLTTTVGSTPEFGTDALRDAVESTWPHVGLTGVAATDLRPGGMGRFMDTIINDERNVDVISDHGFVAAGKKVVVKRKQGTEIIVREATG